MDGARTAGMARAVLERARRRRREEEAREQRAREPPARLSAAFASLGGLLQRAAAECEVRGGRRATRGGREVCGALRGLQVAAELQGRELHVDAHLANAALA